MTAVRHVVPTADDVAAHAHRALLGMLRSALAERGHASVALSGGSTPQQLYARLAADVGGVDLSRVQWFWGDERAVPPDHPASNYRMAHETWLGRAGIPTENIHRMRGEATDLDAEAARYEALLESLLGTPPAVDVVLLGMGGDGHTLSLFPGTPAAREAQRLVVALHSGAPEHARLTLTAPALRAARHLMVLVTGSGKAAMLTRALEGPLDPVALPIQQALRAHPRTELVCDVAAASGLATAP